MKQRIIMHLDLDAFFAAVEERENTEIKGKPVIVGADPKEGKGRGVVSTCNYEARKFGIHSAMPITIAYRLCPTAVFLPVNYDLYEKASGDVMKIAKRYADKFEQNGIDECFLDVSESAKDFEDAKEIALKVKNEVREKEKLSCSMGIGPNKLIAKIASDFQKPDGLTVVKPKDVHKFINPMSVRKIIGVGPKTEKRLNGMGVKTIGELNKLTKRALINEFGNSMGQLIYDSARGTDESELVENWEPKSISREYTFEKDTKDKGSIFKVIEDLSKEVHSDLLKQNYLYKTVTVKIRNEYFFTRTRQDSLESPSQDLNTIVRIAKKLTDPFLKEDRKIRLVGVRTSGLVTKPKTDIKKFIK